MKLKSFGCSFIFGSDLPDSIDHIPSNLTWPALIAQQLGYTYHCYAWPGSGNLRILQSLLKQVTDPDPTLYVIGWTWIDRFDYTTKDDAWKTILPVDRDPVAGVYYKNLHSQYRDKLSSLLAINTALDLLTIHGHKFIMTYMDDLILETRWHCDGAIKTLQDRIKPHLTDFQGETFLEWSKKQGFEISHNLHPLGPAHLSAAKSILADVRLPK